ncbi:MAG: hypothetical protein HKN82_02575 [Akkermansiaceae bacterium]|nr:hypothetical protein [Akkermansiaceae bacterium]NNM28044.1 hypothetical protein [Akkermansiaceae bacterium]
MTRLILAVALLAPFFAGASPAAERAAPAPPASIPSWDRIEADLAAMRVEDVAWRGIEWKTCLLDGLAAARREKKPVVIWCFIDHPIDDKRC